MERHDAPAPRALFDRLLVGQSEPMRQLRHEVERVARTTSTVLIEGETGTGKELVSRAIHELSPRAAGPFVRVNCAAIPAALFESELFGHVRGAFTGAVTQRAGRFEQAEGGTLFLDEIGELPLELQPKLLRVLQEREYERVGDVRTQTSDVRVIAATHRDLRALSARGLFREDLYYRLGVFPLRVPPLRERPDDLPALVAHFVRALAARLGRPPCRVAPEALAQLAHYAFPGNVRELANAIERALILANDETLELDIEFAGESAPAGPAAVALVDVDRAHIVSVLRSTNWVVAGPNGAAARLGMKRTTLHFRMRKLGIVREPARAVG